MARNQRKYDHEYKVQAVKLAREIGGTKAAKELGIPEGTIHTWLKAVKAGTLNIGDGLTYGQLLSILFNKLHNNLYFQLLWNLFLNYIDFY